MQTFKARSMPEALARVKAAFGPQAVILGTRAVHAPGLRGMAGAQQVEITAAPPEEQPPAATPDRDSRIPAHARGQYQRLTAAAVSDQLARRLLSAAGRPGEDPAGDAQQRFQDTVARLIPTAGGIRLHEDRPACVALVGPAGAGKTTTAAKLAAEFVLRQGRRAVLVSLDLHGVGRHEQLARYAELIGARHEAPQSLDAARALRPELVDADLVLVDTSGLGPNDPDRRSQLAEMLAAFRPDERHLVLPASMDAAVQSHMAGFFAELRPNRLLLTRLDEALGMGVVLNTAERLALALSYTSGGQTVPHDLQVACPVELTRAVCSADAAPAIRYSDAGRGAAPIPVKFPQQA